MDKKVCSEKESIARVLGSYTSIEDLKQPCAEAVAQRLRQCSVAHFACHGRVDFTDPSNSSLIFARSDEAGKLVQDPLTVYRVSENNLQNARLAFLSACSTASDNTGRLMDEAIHMVSGFQVAGFPHIVGCLWPSADNVCVEVAHGMYAELAKHGYLDLGNSAIASALQQSVRAVAARDWKRPLNWAQFVHYGA